MNYLQKKKLAFMSIVNQVKGFVQKVTGALPLTLKGCVDENSIIDYKLYGQSVQDDEPTPDNPIEVESVGEKTVNLFNIDSINGLANFDSQLNGYYSILDGVIQSKFGVYGSYTFFQCNVKTLAAGQYVLRCDVSYESGGSVYCGLGFTDKTKIYTFTKVAPSEWTTISYEFELTEDKEIFGIQLQGAGNAENFKDVKCYFKNVMLCKKSDDTGVYEPYGKYKIPVTVSGGNLIGPYNWVSGTNNASFNFDKNRNYITDCGDNYVEVTLPAWGAVASELIDVSRALKFGFKMNKDALIDDYITYNVILQFYDGEGNKLASRAIANNALANVECIVVKGAVYYEPSNASNFSPVSGATHCRIGVVSRAQKIEGLRIYDFYATEETDTEFEPYHEPITTNIYLDEPLRKVGDYADYIDFENGKVVREVGNYTFTGNETNAGGIQETSPCFGYSTRIPTLSLSDTKVGLCNYLYQGIYSNVLSNSRFAFLVKTNHPYVYIYFAKTDFPDLIDYSATIAKEIIKQWYDNNVPMILFYNLATPTEQPITLPNIPTFKGTSIVSADTTIQPSNAEIKYYSNVKE